MLIAPSFKSMSCHVSNKEFHWLFLAVPADIKVRDLKPYFPKCLERNQVMYMGPLQIARLDRTLSSFAQCEACSLFLENTKKYFKVEIRSIVRFDLYVQDHWSVDYMRFQVAGNLGIPPNFMTLETTNGQAVFGLMLCSTLKKRRVLLVHLHG